jgi:hypothetical protein
MSYKEVYTSERVMEGLAEENVQKAEARRLAREVSTGHQSWISRVACQLGQRVAHILIEAGQKLDQATLPPAEPVEVE